MNTWDLIYIAFVDLDGPVSSGSGVRPKAMARAFEDLGLKVKVLDGWPRDRNKRKAAIRDFETWLEDHTARACYIEPPSGPLFLRADRELIRKIHDRGIPIGLFYRDLFWRFDDKFHGVGKWKIRLIRWMQARDLRLFQQNVTRFFFPSPEVARAADFGVAWEALPPGTVVFDDAAEVAATRERLLSAPVLNLLYVGGVLGDYGLSLLLDSLQLLNRTGTRLTLTLVCREAEWQTFQESYPTEDLSWLTVHHVSGDALTPLYAAADLCVIPRQATPYMHFAVPVKLFEYVSHVKPIVATRLEATAPFIEQNGIGWTVDDNPKALSDAFDAILNDRAAAAEKLSALVLTRADNTWEKRAAAAFAALTGSER